MEKKIINRVLYSSDYRLKSSYLNVISYYIYVIQKYRKFMWANFLKHFKASYQRSFLRILWKIILPLVPVSVYILLQIIGVLRGSSEMPKVIYVVVGMTFWQIFSSSMTLAMNAPAKEKAMLKKINMPFILFYISTMGDVLFDYFIRVVLIWGILIFFNINISLSWFLLPIMFLPLMLMGLAFGIFFSFFSVFFDDIRNIVDIGVRYGLFASGVIFPIPIKEGFFGILQLNPIYILLNNLRHFLVFGNMESFAYFLSTIIFIFLFLLFVLKKLYSLESRMREFL